MSLKSFFQLDSHSKNSKAKEAKGQSETVVRGALTAVQPTTLPDAVDLNQFDRVETNLNPTSSLPQEDYLPLRKEHDLNQNYVASSTDNPLEPPQPTMSPLIHSQPSPQKLSSKLLEELARKLKSNPELIEKLKAVVLPGLEDKLQTLKIEQYAMTVQHGQETGKRVVEIMTPNKLPVNTLPQLKKVVHEKMPESLWGDVMIRLAVGEVTHCTMNGVLGGYPAFDGCTRAAGRWNIGQHDIVLMGDSISGSGSKCAATLGPKLSSKDGKRVFYLTNLHPFEDMPIGYSTEDDKSVTWNLVHPACIDCQDGVPPRPIGRMVAHSGDVEGCTTIISQSLRNHGIAGSGLALTDWALFECKDGPGTRSNNRLRISPTDREVETYSDKVTSIENYFAGLIICSTGRSSGYRYGKISDIPAYMRHPTKGKTREWYIENLGRFLKQDIWNYDGLGISGDSGAAVVIFESQKLAGQVYGCNTYQNGGDPRVTYFTAMADILNDIMEKAPSLGQLNLFVEPDGEDTCLDEAQVRSSKRRIAPAQASRDSDRAGSQGVILTHYDMKLSSSKISGELEVVGDKGSTSYSSGSVERRLSKRSSTIRSLEMETMVHKSDSPSLLGQPFTKRSGDEESRVKGEAQVVGNRSLVNLLANA
jgi:hypothetical protein